MCGLFGMTLPHRYPTDLLRRDAAIAFLGALAEERGRDSAGIAARLRSPGEPHGGWVVNRHTGPFTEMAGPRRLRGLINATAAIGHTRWATQGPINLANASPLRAGVLLGAHNGDLDTSTIAFAPEWIDPSWTDSRILFTALATAHTTGRVNTRRLVTILSAMSGRAALVWASMSDNGRVWLARAGLSPLAIAHDVDGGLWWASNPEWLRLLSSTFDLPMRRIWLVPEGTLISATPQHRRVKATVHAQFKPTVRQQDLRLVRGAVWRNFTPADRRDDNDVMRHRVVGTPLRDTPLHGDVATDRSLARWA